MLEGLGIETGVNLEKLVSTSVWMARQLGRTSVSRTLQALAGPEALYHADPDADPATAQR